jgi:hypothetical protein
VALAPAGGSPGGNSPIMLQGERAAGRLTLWFDTHSNHLGETSEPGFIIPKARQYIVQVIFYGDRDRRTVVCEKSVGFSVK